MAKSKERRFWMTGTVIVLVVVSLFFPLANSAGAIFMDVNAIGIMLGVESEIMHKTPVGRYYYALYEKHQNEINQILSDHPAHALNESMKLIQIFAPGLESLLNNEGDTIKITEEQVISLKAELDWFSSLASPPLREDIEKEQKRLPLDNFIGMTMSEALDFLNSNLPPEPVADVTKIPTASPTLICMAGTGLHCTAEPSLVPDSNGEWAYYIYNNTYFEYPSSWQIEQRLGDRSVLIISPAPGSSEEMHFGLIAVMFITDLRIENWDAVFTTSQPAWERANTEWKQYIYLDDFEGFECLWQYSNEPAMDLEFFLYNESRHTSVGLLARTKDNNVADLMDNPDTTNKMFPNIQHIVESIRIWKHARDEHQVDISVMNYVGHKDPP